MSLTKATIARSIALIGVKTGAFLLTGSAVLMAGVVDSVVDLVAAIIAAVIRPVDHHSEHQLALIQNAWIAAGGFLVFTETIRHMDEGVSMATTGIAILVFALVADAIIVRMFAKVTNPVLVGLKEDIKADMLSSLTSMIALTAITLGAPMMVDKVFALAISSYLMFKGSKLFVENMDAASNDHEIEHHGFVHEVEGFNPAIEA
jgi:divalent metal cation (Fe/Co/Zn/Cd) transporter